MPYEIPTRWPLISHLANRESNLFKDARIFNGYAELDPDTKQYSIERRPGVISTPFTTIPNGTSQGLFSFDQSVIQLNGGFAFRNGLPLGVVGFGAGATGLYTAGFTTSDVDIMMLANATFGCVINGFTLSRINDPNYPGTIAPGIGYLNGRFYVMDPVGRIFGTKNLDDPTVWDPLNVIVAQQRSGAGVYLAQQLAYLCAMKSKTVEVFWDSGQTQTQGASGSTLQPIPGATIPYGCQDPGSVQSFDSTLIWMTTNESGSPQIGRMDNLQFQIISTPPVDRLLKLASYGATGSLVLKLGGHRFYVLHLTPVLSGSFTLVYDLDQNFWYVWTDPKGAQWPYYHSCALGTSTPPLTFVQNLNGQAYAIQEGYLTPTDQGAIIPVDIYTPNYDAGIDRNKFMSSLYFNSDIVPGSQLTLRYSDNDYKTWTSPLLIDLGIEKPQVTDLGSFYRRAFHLRHSMAMPFRIKSMGMQMSLGSL